MLNTIAGKTGKVLIELSVIPLGSNGQTSNQIAKVWEIFSNTDLLLERTLTGTCIEGEWNEISPLIFACYELIQDESPQGFLRVSIR